MHWTCGQCCLFHIWVVGSKIAIVLDMWSVMCVSQVGVAM